MLRKFRSKRPKKRQRERAPSPRHSSSLSDEAPGSHTLRKTPGDFSRVINTDTFLFDRKVRIDPGHHYLVVQSKHDPDDTVAMRLRVGSSSYAQWLNELNVYLLPNLNHKNILPFLGCDKVMLVKRYGKTFSSFTHLTPDEVGVQHSASFRRAAAASQSSSRSGEAGREDELEMIESKYFEPPTVNFWILNRIGLHDRTLREFLEVDTLTWPEMIHIATGIMSGLDYLHEHASYVYKPAEANKMVNNFIKSTQGALKRVSFRTETSRIYMTPPLAITIIHRQLSSMNIVLRQDMTPCIWNFGQASVYHPFQPVDFEHLVDKPIKQLHMTSPYSPPEVLIERGTLTLHAMKSIDMYATGIVLWEMMSRCVLPKLLDGSLEENYSRGVPELYSPPYAREFQDDSGEYKESMLRWAVATKRTRPQPKVCWLVGKKTNLFYQMIRNLWDHDWEARLLTGPALARLARFTLSDRDKRYRHNLVMDPYFSPYTMWPPFYSYGFGSERRVKIQPNIVIQDLAKPKNKPRRRVKRKQSRVI